MRCKLASRDGDRQRTTDAPDSGGHARPCTRHGWSQRIRETPCSGAALCLWRRRPPPGCCARRRRWLEKRVTAGEEADCETVGALVERDVVIVSGLAAGIDTVAHP